MLTELFYTINNIIALVAAITALIFAFLTLVVVIINRQCRTVTNLLICDTAIATILFCTVGFISSVYSRRSDWLDYQPACAFRAYLQIMLSTSICYSYSIQAISRLFYSVYYKKKYLQTWRIHWILIIISWIISILTPIVPFFFEHGYELQTVSRVCTISAKVTITSIYIFITMFFIPLNLVIIIYGIILHFARQSARRIAAHASSTISSLTTGNVARPNMKREMKLMKNMLIRSSILACGGIPYSILVLWYAIQKETVPEPLYSFSIYTVVIFIAISMVALFFMNKQVKKRTWQHMRDFWRKWIIRTAS
jgi:hypothetical protein